MFLNVLEFRLMFFVSTLCCSVGTADEEGVGEPHFTAGEVRREVQDVVGERAVVVVVVASSRTDAPVSVAGGG